MATTTAQPAARFQTDNVATVSAGHAVHDTFMAFLAPLLPILIEKFSLAKAEAGLLAAIVNAPSLLNPFIGYLADHVEMRYLVIVTPAISTILMSLLGVAPSYLSLAVLLLLAGISSATLHATGPVMAGNLAGSRLGRAMSFWMVGGELGRTLGPLVIVSAVQYLTLKNTPWLSVFGVATSIVLWVRLRGISVRPAPAEDRAAARPSARAAWGLALRKISGILLPLTAVCVLRAFLVTGVSTYLPTYLGERGETLFFAGASLSVMEAAGVVGALLGGSLSDRIGRRPVLLVSVLAAPLLVLVMLQLNGLAVLPVLMGAGFFMLSTTPVLMALVQESLPESRALANGIFMAISFVGSSVAAVAVGALADRTSLSTAYAVACGLCLLAGAFVIPLTRPRMETDKKTHR